jgi:uncharacterized protein YkwD
VQTSSVVHNGDLREVIADVVRQAGLIERLPSKARPTTRVCDVTGGCNITPLRSVRHRRVRIRLAFAVASARSAWQHEGMRVVRMTRLATLVAMWAIAGCSGTVFDDEGGASGAQTGGADTGVPADGHCSATEGWDASWATLEDEVLAIVNMHRAQGATCGGQSFGSAPALVMQANLLCAARLHSRDMAERGFFSHDNPDGQSPWDRMEEAGYVDWRAVGENIAAGSATAAGTMDQWMNSPGHCANIMSPEFTEIGVGYHPGGSHGHLWTQKFGRR